VVCEENKGKGVRVPIKRLKDESKLIAKWKIKSGNRHYFHVFLWKNQKAFDENTLDNNPHTSLGCVNLAPTIMLFTNKGTKKIIRPKLGEVHFIKDKWDLEVVAHELCHALIQRLRMIKPSAKSVVEQTKNNEETICYEFGEWVDKIYRMLWKVNKSKSWIKK
jgi:hypothetical protein